MDETTQQQIEQIERRGWYPVSQTLGEGGWLEVYKFARLWKVYELTIVESEYISSTIIARNDDSAISAFHSLFTLNNRAYEIKQRQTSYRLIESDETRK